MHHSDQGAQYAAAGYIGPLLSAGIRVSMAAKAQPTANPYAERVIRTIKEDEVALSEYQNLADAPGQIGYFLDEVYQTKRIHPALGYLTPHEFEVQWYAAQTESLVWTATPRRHRAGRRLCFASGAATPRLRPPVEDEP